MAYYSAYMMYSRHLAQLFGDGSDGIRSGLDDDGSYMEICGGVFRLEGVNFPYLVFFPPNPPNIVK
jgi:hypothetical protein